MDRRREEGKRNRGEIEEEKRERNRGEIEEKREREIEGR